MRLIDADALLTKPYIMKEPNGFIHSVVTARQIEAAPTIDAVPVVRCAECKHNNPSRAIGDSNMWCDYWGVDPDPDDFCRWGERRSDENLS